MTTKIYKNLRKRYWNDLNKIVYENSCYHWRFWPYLNCVTLLTMSEFQYSISLDRIPNISKISTMTKRGALNIWVRLSIRAGFLSISKWINTFKDSMANKLKHPGRDMDSDDPVEEVLTLHTTESPLPGCKKQEHQNGHCELYKSKVTPKSRLMEK